MNKIVLSLVVTSCFISPWSWAAQASEQPSQSQAITVKVERAKIMQVPDSIPALGTMEAVQSTDLSFSSAGHLASTLFKSGDQVKKDDVIATLDDADMQAKVASLKANLDAAKSKYQRYQLLKDSGVFSKQDILEVNTAYKIAEADYASALTNVHNLKLIAPFDGTLGEFQYSLGAYMDVGQPVVRLVQLDPLKVTYSFDQTARQFVKLNQDVDITTDTLPGQTFHGKVTFISPTQDTATGRFNLEAEVDNHAYKMAPGFFVHISQITSSGESYTVIPQTAVVADQDQTFVYKVINGIAKKIPVTLGKNSNDGFVVINNGVNIGEAVVVDGTQKLDDGISVSVIQDNKPAKQTDTKSPAPTKKSPTQQVKSQSKTSLDSIETKAQPSKAQEPIIEDSKANNFPQTSGSEINSKQKTPNSTPSKPNQAQQATTSKTNGNLPKAN